MIATTLIQPGVGRLRGESHGLLGRSFGRLLGIPHRGSCPAAVGIDGTQVVRWFGRTRWASRVEPSVDSFTEYFVGRLGVRFALTTSSAGADFTLTHVVVGRWRVPAPRWLTIAGTTRSGVVHGNDRRPRLVTEIRVVAPLARITYVATVDGKDDR